MVLESFLTSFKQFQFLNQTDRSARAIAFGSMDNFADLEKLNAFQNILCFSNIAFSARNGLFMRKCVHVSVKNSIFV